MDCLQIWALGYHIQIQKTPLQINLNKYIQWYSIVKSELIKTDKTEHKLILTLAENIINVLIVQFI